MERLEIKIVVERDLSGYAWGEGGPTDLDGEIMIMDDYDDIKGRLEVWLSDCGYELADFELVKATHTGHQVFVGK